MNREPNVIGCCGDCGAEIAAGDDPMIRIAEGDYVCRTCFEELYEIPVYAGMGCSTGPYC